MQFNGRSPATEARRYVYAVMASCLDNDRRNKEGWVWGGTNEEPWEERDRVLLDVAVKVVVAELERKARR